MEKCNYIDITKNRQDLVDYLVEVIDDTHLEKIRSLWISEVNIVTGLLYWRIYCDNCIYSETTYADFEIKGFNYDVDKFNVSRNNLVDKYRKLMDSIGIRQIGDTFSAYLSALDRKNV